VLKELADNALDEDAKVEVGELPNKGAYFVEDDGPGIDGTPEEIAQLFSINRPMVSTKLLRLPTRGAIGNGLRVVAGAVLASSGTLVVRGFLREDETVERLSAIVTGVPRCGRDVPLEPHHLQRAAPQEPAPWWTDKVGKISHQERVWESEHIGDWIDITTSIGGKNESDPGRIIPGSYRHKGNNFIEVRGDDGKSLGVHPISAGDDVLTFARKLLREGRNSQFWDRPVRTPRIPL